MEEEELCYSPYVHRYGNSRRGFADDYVRELAVRLDGHFMVSRFPFVKINDLGDSIVL